MKIVAVTQRVDFIEDRSEKRDSVDQKYIELMECCNLLPILIPNNINIAKKIVGNLSLDGIILTGGNDLVSVGGNAPERDLVEKTLIKYAIEHNIPLLGICRGMQIIQEYFGVKLEKLEGHVRTFFDVRYKDKLLKINSFHNWGTKLNNEAELTVLSKSMDEVVKAIEHKRYKINGIMWHPERDCPFTADNIEIICEIFN